MSSADTDKSYIEALESKKDDSEEDCDYLDKGEAFTESNIFYRDVLEQYYGHLANMDISEENAAAQMIDDFGDPSEWSSDLEFDRMTWNQFGNLNDLEIYLYIQYFITGQFIDNPEIRPSDYSKKTIQEIHTDDIGKMVEVDIVVNNLQTQGNPIKKRFNCLSQDCGSEFTRIKTFNEDSHVSCNMCGSTETTVQDVKEHTDEMILSVQSVVNPKSWTSEKMKIVVHGELAERNISQGEELTVKGVVLSEEQSKDSDRVDLFLLGLEMESYEESQQLEIDEDDIQEIQELSHEDNLEQMMINTIAPDLVGVDDLKRGALYSLLSGLHDDVDRRTRLHTLYLGDPETGKTSVLKWIRENVSHTVFTGAGNSTKAGLTIGNVRDEITGDYMVKLGTIPQAHKGYALLDELDGADFDDLKALNNPLEDGIATKASIEGAEVPAETTVIASANPKDREFDPYEPIYEQFGFPSDFTSRFDLIYTPQKGDTTEAQKDEITGEILAGFSEERASEPPIETEMFAKYIQFARQLEPTLSTELLEYSKEQVREMDVDIGNRKTRTIGAVSVASARLHLRSQVSEYDIDVAIEVLTESLNQYSGEYEYDPQAEFGYPSEDKLSEREEVLQVVELLQHTNDPIKSEDEWAEKCEDKGIERERAEKHIEELQNEGTVFKISGYFQT